MEGTACLQKAAVVVRQLGSKTDDGDWQGQSEEKMVARPVLG